MSTTERGYRIWTPQRKTLAVLDQINEIFDEYEAQRPLTIRQIFYRLVAAYDFPKQETDYGRLINYLDRARRARMIPFDWIRDDGVRGEDYGEVWNEPKTPEDWLAAYLKEQQGAWQNYYISLDTGQPRRVELWCEAAGMHDQLKRIADRYDWPTFSGGGAESLTARHQAVERAARQPELPTVILHVGDHDIAGRNIFEAFEGDVEAFLAGDAPEAEIAFVRVAVRPDQVGDDTPGYEPKQHANKGWQTELRKWYDAGNDLTYQAEALPPDRLAAIVDQALRDHTDLDVLADMREAEEQAREWLKGEFKERFGSDEVTN